MDCEKIALPTKAKVHQKTVKLVECDSVEVFLSIQFLIVTSLLASKNTNYLSR